MKEEFIAAFVVSVLVLLTGGVIIVCISTLRRGRRDIKRPRLRLFLLSAAWFVIVIGAVATAVSILSLAVTIIGARFGSGQGLDVVTGAGLSGAVGLGMLAIFVGKLLIDCARIQQPESTDEDEFSSESELMLDRKLSQLNFSGWITIGIALASLGVLAMWSMQEFIGLLLLIVIVMVPILLVVVELVCATNNQARQGHFLWLLAIAVEKDIPLADEIATHANTLSGRRGRRMHEMALLLRDGTALHEALDEVPGLVPRFAVLLACTGAQTGTLAQSLRQAAVFHATSMQRSTTDPSISWILTYFSAILTLITLVVSFLMYYITPKYKKIFQDFDTELPGATMLLINVSDFFVDYFYIIFPLFFLLILGLVLAGMAFDWGWGNLKVPWLTRWFPRFDTPWILRNLVRIVRAKRPISDGLSALSLNHHRGHISRRLDRVASAVEDGVDCWQAMREEGFITSRELAVLEAAQRVGNLPWALAELADGIERRQRYRLRFWFEVFRPIVIFIVGLSVAFICVGFFLPVVKLINDLS